PTTHLDVGSIDALIGALKQYHGTLIFISHDVHFIRAIATSALHISAGANRTGSKLTFVPGDYDYYLDKSKATSARIALTAGRHATTISRDVYAGSQDLARLTTEWERLTVAVNAP